MNNASVPLFHQLHFLRPNSKLDLLVIQPELMNYRREPIVVVDDAVNRIMREVIGSSVNIATFESAACNPLAKAIRVVIATNFVTLCQPFAELDHRQPSHLATPVNDRTV